MKVWAIKRYNEVFESAASRKLAVPNYLNLCVHHDSEAFRWLMRQGRDGHAAFGDFVAIVQIVATLGRTARLSGVLYSSGRALGPVEVASRLGSIKSVLERSWDILSDSQCGWLYQVEWDAASHTQNAGSEGTDGARETTHPPPARQSPASRPPPGGAERSGSEGTERSGAGAPLIQPQVHPPRPAPPESIHAMLARAGIDGEALARLAACPEITPTSLIRDVREIEADKTVQSVKRVLVDRLCKRHGISLGKKPRSAGDHAIREIERLRERRNATGVAEAQRDDEEAA